MTVRRPHPRSAGALAAAVLLLTGCGVGTSPDEAPTATPPDSASPTPSATAAASESPASESPAPGSESPEAAPTATRIDVTIGADSVSPNGERVRATAGAPVVLTIDAARAGELHVHSSPEQEISYPAGRSTRRLTVDVPGLVEVEDHDLDAVVVQLEVR